MLVKEELVEVQNDCIVIQGDFETVRLQLAAASPECFEKS